jgi:cellobiose PTS system EIIC component
MDKFTRTLEEFVLPVADKLSNNKSLQAVMGGFLSLLPITILGAIGTLLGSFNFAAYQSFITSTGLKVIFGYIPGVTTGMLAVYAAFAIAKALADNLGYQKHSSIIGVTTLFVFFLMIPLGVSGVAPESKEAVTIGGALGTMYLGAPGLFSAILLALIVPRIYGFVVDRGWTFKMPEGVPPMVSNSFASLIPAFIVALTFALVRYGFSFTSYGNFNAFLYSTIQSPLRGFAASPFTFMLFLFLVSTFWFFGIHGGLVVLPVLTALYTPLNLENLAALELGTTLPNIIVQSDWFIYGMIGGGGGTLGFCIWMAFFAKSKRYRSLGRLALPASLVGINEPITFGAPVVMNPMLYIPFTLAPLVTFGLSYILRVVGILTPLNGTAIPTGTPVIFSALIAGGWQHALVQVILIAIGFFIYLPFAQILDKRALADEHN